MQVAHLDVSQITNAQAQEPQSISQPPSITEPERKALAAVQPTLTCTSIPSINVSGSNMFRVQEVKEKVKSKQVLREKLPKALSGTEAFRIFKEKEEAKRAQEEAKK